MDLTTCWSTPPVPGPTLFVVFGYHGRDLDTRPSWLLGAFESPSARGHRIVHRDHYANPRTLDYELAMVGSAVQVLCPDVAPDVVVDTAVEGALPAEFASRCGTVERAALADPGAWRRGLLARSAAITHVVLVYPDALGLGCGAAEHLALRGRERVFVINGRRRVFVLDRALRRRVEWRRFLARTRIVERGLAAAVRPVAAALALVDRIRGVAS